MKKNKILFTNKEIQMRISQLSTEINDYYKDKSDIAILGVLNGSFMFISDLVKNIKFECAIDFIKVSSYGDESKPTSTPEILFSPSINLKNKRILIIDDIADTGNTIKFLYKFFEQFSPKEIKSCCLIEKIGNNFDIDWFGFKISSNFIYGYGMDYKLLHRNLNSIYEIDINEE